MFTRIPLVLPVQMLLALCAGCGPMNNFSTEEMIILETFLLDEPPPDDPTNAWADDALAAEFGHQLFFDPRFSGPLLLASDLGEAGDLDRVSCSSCHDPANGGADRRSQGPTSLGAGWTDRNAPTVLNAAYLQASRWTLWDGRKDSLWSQALGPPESILEHNATRLHMAHVTNDVYPDIYESIFGPLPDLSDETRFTPLADLCDFDSCQGGPGDPVWAQMSEADQLAVTEVYVNYGKATAAYERLLVTNNSPFDRYLRGEDTLTNAAIRGAKLFVGRASCDECHSGPTFTDGDFHNLGVQVTGANNGPAPDVGRAKGVDKLLNDEFNAASQWSDAPDDTAHLDDLTGGGRMRGAFKTPTLRNVAQTAPYMHNGSIETLWDVLEFYRFGGRNDGLLGEPDPEMRALSLSDEDLHDLIAFLESLSDDSLPSDLTRAPELP